MSLDEAKAHIAEIAGREVLDIPAIRICAARSEGECCDVQMYSEARRYACSVGRGDVSALMAERGYEPFALGAAYCRTCPRHQPTKRYAWVADIDPAAFAAFCEARTEAFAIEEMRVLLPKSRPFCGVLCLNGDYCGPGCHAKSVMESAERAKTERAPQAPEPDRGGFKFL